MSYDWPDSDALNKELRDKILAYERANPDKGQSKSNVGGWHSETGQLQFCGAAGKTLIDAHGRASPTRRRARTLAGRTVPPTSPGHIEAWVNVNRAGDFNRIAHPRHVDLVGHLLCR